MAIVKGDRIGESQRVNRCSVAAQDFYAAMLAAVPDDFGRFRNSATHIFIRMYPRREPTVAALRRIKRYLLELENAGLWRAWEIDGVVWAELRNATPTGNLYHRTPEPPAMDPPDDAWKPHVHSRRCATTAKARGQEWKTETKTISFPLPVNELGGTEVEQGPSRGRAEVEHSSLPSPSSLPYGLTDSVANATADVPLIEPTPPPPEPTTATTQRRKRTSTATPSWVAEAVTDWELTFGAGSGGRIYGRVGFAMKPLIAARGWPEVRPVWQAYLAAEDAKFLSPEAFVAKYAYHRHSAGIRAPAPIAAGSTEAGILECQEFWARWTADGGTRDGLAEDWLAYSAEHRDMPFDQRKDAWAQRWAVPFAVRCDVWPLATAIEQRRHGPPGQMEVSH